MSCKYTPGPWTIQRAVKTVDNDLQKAEVITAIGPIEADCWTEDPYTYSEVWLDVNEANARLIAAAPEMYEALRRCERIFLKGVDHIGDEEWDETSGLVFAALAKARGEVGK